MNPSDLAPEDVSWWTADQALAADTPVDVPSGSNVQRDLIFLRRVRQALTPSTPSAPIEAAPATIGRFLVRRELGRGTFGVVFLAHDPLLNREVALKVPRPEVLVTPELRARFRREARAAAGLDHPHLVPVYEVGETGPVCFLVSAYCPGPTLAQWLRQRTEPVPFNEAAQLVASLADAVEHAHRHGVVHRDLKPSNVLLQMQNAERRMQNPEKPKAPFCILHSAFCIPRITDFGLAKLLDADPDSDLRGYPTRSGTVIGTVNYMAPEQAGGKTRKVSPAADTYSLGAILYELLTGRPPFQGESELDTLHQVREEEPVPPTRLRPRLPRDLETICLHCLRKVPSERYPTTGALAEDLRLFLAGKPIPTRPIRWRERAWRWCRRNPTLAAAGGLVAASLFVVVALALGIAYVQSNAATQTKNALDKAEKQFALAEHRLAVMALDQGINLCEKSNTGHGMLWLARSLEIANRLPAPGDVDLERAIRANLGSWRRNLASLRGQFPLKDGACERGVAFSPDGKTVLMATRDGTVSLWDVATGQPLGQPLPHPGGVIAVAFCADGRLVATGGKDKTARLWEAATGKPVGAPLSHEGEVGAVAFSPDGKTLLTGSTDTSARLWDVATGRLLGSPLPHQGAILSVAFSPNGQLLITGSMDRMARLWETATGKLWGKPLLHNDPVYAVAFSPDGQMVLGGSNKAQLWEVASGQRLANLEHPRIVHGVAFSPDGKLILTGGNDGTAQVWEVATYKHYVLPLEFPTEVKAVAFSPDGKLILTGIGGGPAQLWEISRGHDPVASFKHQAAVKDVAVSRDGRLFLTTSNDKTAQVWEAATGKPFGPSLEHPDRVLNGVFSPDGRIILTGCADGIARFWEAATGKPCGHPLRHVRQVNAVAFSPDGRTVLTGAGQEVRFWEAATGRALERILRHRDSIEALAFSPDGRIVLSGSTDQTAQQWDALTGQPLGPALRHRGKVTSVAFAADGRTILTGSTDRTAQLWDATTGKALGQPLLPSQAIHSVAISPNGKILLTGTSSYGLLWDAATSRLIGPRLSIGGMLTGVFSPDGRTVLTGSESGLAHLWVLSAPVDGSVERIVLGVQVLTGMEMDGQNVLRVLDAPTWQQRRQRLQELGGSPF
jgi:WD40 repeat protein